jgi:peptide/nickel transport system substrate-binding protein
LTADDVVFTFEYYRDGPRQSLDASRFQSAAPGNRNKTRVLQAAHHRNQTHAELRYQHGPELPIVQKKQWQSINKPRTFRDLLIGTGPYKLVDYKADEYYRFKANEEYWL